MCKKNGKSLDHFLLHCKVAKDLLVLIFRHFGIKGFMSHRLMELLACWIGQLSSH